MNVVRRNAAIARTVRPVRDVNVVAAAARITRKGRDASAARRTLVRRKSRKTDVVSQVCPIWDRPG